MNLPLINYATAGTAATLESMFQSIKVGDCVWQAKQFLENNGGPKLLPHEWANKGLEFIRLIDPNSSHTPEDIDRCLRLADRWRKVEAIYAKSQDVRWLTEQVAEMLLAYIQGVGISAPES